MRTISLTQGFVALVDDEDFDRVSGFKWTATKTKTNVYAVHKVRTAGGRHTSQLLHRFIMDVTNPDIDVDHKDHDGLNCQRANLRLCVRGENNGNAKKRRGTSKFKGVSWDSGRQLWRAHITVRGRLTFLGRYGDERDAAIAYDDAARSAFGEFALVNFDLQEIAHLP